MTNGAWTSHHPGWNNEASREVVTYWGHGEWVKSSRIEGQTGAPGLSLFWSERFCESRGNDCSESAACSPTGHVFVTWPRGAVLVLRAEAGGQQSPRAAGSWFWFPGSWTGHPPHPGFLKRDLSLWVGAMARWTQITWNQGTGWENRFSEHLRCPWQSLINSLGNRFFKCLNFFLLKCS